MKSMTTSSEVHTKDMVKCPKGVKPREWRYACERAARAKSYAEKMPEHVRPSDLKFQDPLWQWENEDGVDEESLDGLVSALMKTLSSKKKEDKGPKSFAEFLNDLGMEDFQDPLKFMSKSSKDSSENDDLGEILNRVQEIAKELSEIPGFPPMPESLKKAIADRKASVNKGPRSNPFEGLKGVKVIASGDDLESLLAQLRSTGDDGLANTLAKLLSDSK